MKYRFESYSFEFNQERLGCSANTRSEELRNSVDFGNQKYLTLSKLIDPKASNNSYKGSVATTEIDTRNKPNKKQETEQETVLTRTS